MKTIFELFLNSLSGSGLTHGLTLDTITKDEDNQCTLTFTGTAKLGDLTIMVDKEALTADTDSDVLTVPVSAVTFRLCDRAINSGSFGFDWRNA